LSDFRLPSSFDIFVSDRIQAIDQRASLDYSLILLAKEERML